MTPVFLLGSLIFWIHTIRDVLQFGEVKTWLAEVFHQKPWPFNARPKTELPTAILTGILGTFLLCWGLT